MAQSPRLDLRVAVGEGKAIARDAIRAMALSCPGASRWSDVKRHGGPCQRIEHRRGDAVLLPGMPHVVDADAAVSCRWQASARHDDKRSTRDCRSRMGERTGGEGVGRIPTRTPETCDLHGEFEKV